MRHLTWAEFDVAVERMAMVGRMAPLSGVYGLPRGGLPLAVALSHRLKLPLLQEPQRWCLVVDDVYETGRTLEPFREAEAHVVVWMSKVRPTWWSAAEVISSSEWLVFPWEDPAAAKSEEESYRASRQ